MSRLVEELRDEKRKLELRTQQSEQQRRETDAARQQAFNAQTQLAANRQLIIDLRNQVSQLEFTQQQLDNVRVRDLRADRDVRER